MGRWILLEESGGMREESFFEWRVGRREMRVERGERRVGRGKISGGAFFYNFLLTTS